MISKDNLFDIPDPETWACSITSFTNTHNLMTIMLSKNLFKEKLFVEFRKVAYFSGVMTWVGADFSLKAEEERLKVIRKFATLRLFSVQSVRGEKIYIIANAARKLDEDNNMLIEV